MKQILIPSLLALACAPALAQNSVLFTGRFPFVSLDQPNATAAGADSVTMLEEFDISIVTPGTGAFARSWIPSTAHHSFMGDPLNNGNYTFFRGFKGYFDRINFAGPFVKAADKANPDPSKVYWTVRDDDSPLQIDIRTQNGTMTVPLAPGDFIRWDCNGNVEYFITQAQIMTAAGMQTGSWRDGASAICQDAAGNLYYSPAERGHWVNGNQGGPVFCNDGSIVMIDAANITYDMTTGNVQSVVPGSARALFEEVSGGPGVGGISVRGMVANSNLQDRTGQPVGAWANTVGLDLDPNGGMITASFPDINGNFTMVPNFVFCTDSGGYGGAIVSSVSMGSVAMINGVQMGSNTPGVPSDGSYLGVQLDIANFQPTLMGLAVTGTPAADPFVLDAPDWGAIDVNTTQMTWDVHGHTTPTTGVFLVADLGPSSPGGGASCVESANSPFASFFAPGSFPFLFTLNPLTLAIVVSDSNGYINFSRPNFHDGTFTGATLVLHALSVQGSQFQLSNPVLQQLK